MREREPQPHWKFKWGVKGETTCEVGYRLRGPHDKGRGPARVSPYPYPDLQANAVEKDKTSSYVRKRTGHVGVTDSTASVVSTASEEG
jgi:hypothetical protein